MFRSCHFFVNMTGLQFGQVLKKVRIDPSTFRTLFCNIFAWVRLSASGYGALKIKPTSDLHEILHGDPHGYARQQKNAKAHD